MKLPADPKLPIFGGTDYARSLYQRLYALFRQISAAVNGNADAIDANAQAVSWLKSTAIGSCVKFEESDTWVVPEGIDTVYVSVCAAGGGGGAAGGGGLTTYIGSGGGGGGAGQSVVRVKYSVTPGATLNVAIGAAGMGGTGTLNNGNAGTAGGNTVLSGAISLTLIGGGGGGAGVIQNGAIAGGGLGGAGFPNGGDGSDCSYDNPGSGAGGAGASSPFGAGGPSVRSSIGAPRDGNNAFGYGAGGGGGGGIYSSASDSHWTGGAGGVGSPGLVIIEW